MLISVCLISTFIIIIIIYFFYICTRFLLSGLGPEAYVALLLVNTHFLFFILKICVLTGIFLLFFLNFIARIEDLSNQARQTESLRPRVLFCSGWPGS